ncbi:hypothetical protein LJC63_02430 [Ruminococcaceae bacterium OttesenSCG-928-L11]|nr:hypothetical protein [Ruminococcaceae bacterium OttesenSCG-928-L11]
MDNTQWIVTDRYASDTDTQRAENLRLAVEQYLRIILREEPPAGEVSPE